MSWPVLASPHEGTCRRQSGGLEAPHWEVEPARSVLLPVVSSTQEGVSLSPPEAKGSTSLRGLSGQGLTPTSNRFFDLQLPARKCLRAGPGVRIIVISEQNHSHNFLPRRWGLKVRGQPERL